MLNSLYKYNSYINFPYFSTFNFVGCFNCSGLIFFVFNVGFKKYLYLESNRFSSSFLKSMYFGLYFPVLNIFSSLDLYLQMEVSSKEKKKKFWNFFSSTKLNTNNERKRIIFFNKELTKLPLLKFFYFSKKKSQFRVYCIMKHKTFWFKKFLFNKNSSFKNFNFYKHIFISDLLNYCEKFTLFFFVKLIINNLK